MKSVEGHSFHAGGRRRRNLRPVAFIWGNGRSGGEVIVDRVESTILRARMDNSKWKSPLDSLDLRDDKQRNLQDDSKTLGLHVRAPRRRHFVFQS